MERLLDNKVFSKERGNGPWALRGIPYPLLRWGLFLSILKHISTRSFVSWSSTWTCNANKSPAILGSKNMSPDFLLGRLCQQLFGFLVKYQCFSWHRVDKTDLCLHPFLWLVPHCAVVRNWLAFIVASTGIPPQTHTNRNRQKFKNSFLRLRSKTSLLFSLVHKSVFAIFARRKHVPLLLRKWLGFPILT